MHIKREPKRGFAWMAPPYSRLAEEYKREANWTPGGPDVVFMRLKDKK